MEIKVIRCKECDSVVFSMECQKKKLCLDCQGYEDEAKELEDRLEESL